jgi:LacI family transcriptional regulator, gluconate utilization system Gnt-I transcriptional repressor
LLRFARNDDMLVGFDHEAAGAAAAEYFLSRGHDTFAIFPAADQRARARQRGFIERATAGGGRVIDPPAPSRLAVGLCAPSPRV